MQVQKEHHSADPVILGCDLVCCFMDPGVLPLTIDCEQQHAGPRITGQARR